MFEYIVFSQYYVGPSCVDGRSQRCRKNDPDGCGRVVCVHRLHRAMSDHLASQSTPYKSFARTEVLVASALDFPLKWSIAIASATSMPKSQYFTSLLYSIQPRISAPSATNVPPRNRPIRSKKCSFDFTSRSPFRLQRKSAAGAFAEISMSALQLGTLFPSWVATRQRIRSHPRVRYQGQEPRRSPRPHLSLDLRSCLLCAEGGAPRKLCQRCSSVRGWHADRAQTR